MKKITLGLFCLFLSLGIAAQEYHSLSSGEIAECKSPQAVAWNFVMSIVNEDYARMESLCEKAYVNEMREWMRADGIASYSQIYTEEVIHDICGMRPVLREGWQLVCDDEYYHDVARYDRDGSYNGLKGCSVSFDCMKDGQIYSWSDNREHDTTARVILVNKDNKWQVIGFK